MALLGTLSILGFIVSLIWTIVLLFKRGKMKKPAVGMLICLIVFYFAVTMDKSYEEKFSERYALPINTTRSLFEVGEYVGISSDQIKNLKQIADWENGERYTFEYKNTVVIAYVERDGQVSTLRSGATDLYRAK